MHAVSACRLVGHELVLTVFATLPSTSVLAVLSTLSMYGICLRAGACHHGLPWAGACTPLVPVLVTMGCLRAGCLGLMLVIPLVLAYCHGLPSGRVAFGLCCLRAVLISFPKSLCTSSDAAALNGQTLYILYYRHRRASFRCLPSYLITY